MINNIKEKISTGKTGAISELIVCADLLDKGYEVFRSISQSCSCDLIAMKNNEIIKIEVKTGRIKSDGNIGYAIKEEQKNNFDILAIVVNQSITYLEHDAAMKETTIPKIENQIRYYNSTYFKNHPYENENIS